MGILTKKTEGSNKHPFGWAPLSHPLLLVASQLAEEVGKFPFFLFPMFVGGNEWYTLPKKLTFSHLENGWLEDLLVSFWGKQPIFRGELLPVRFRECTCDFDDIIFKWVDSQANGLFFFAPPPGDSLAGPERKGWNFTPVSHWFSAIVM